MIDRLKVFGACIVPGVVSFVVGLGLGKMFGQKHGYEVIENSFYLTHLDRTYNQELITKGTVLLAWLICICCYADPNQLLYYICC